MPIGPGKYDSDCTAIREKHNAVGVMLIVFDGNNGSEFSCQLPLVITSNIPAVLRDVANQIEADYKQGIV